MTLGESLQVIGILGGAGILTKLLQVMVQTRDAIRDHIRDVGSKGPPPTGLFLKVYELRDAVEAHNDALAKLGFERRHTTVDRRRDTEE